jgi:hypothetical protein
MPYWLAPQRRATSLFEGSTFWSGVAPANFRLKRRADSAQSVRDHNYNEPLRRNGSNVAAS